MALVLGNNCGFVAAAPVADPDDANFTCDYSDRLVRDTSPVGADTITEVGWWCDNATEEANFEVGLYDDDTGNDDPQNLLEVDRTNAKGLGSGWKAVVGLNWSISASTLYWIAFQLDNTATSTLCNHNNDDFDGEWYSRDFVESTLDNPYTGSGLQDDYYAIYAKYTSAAPEGTNVQIQIGGAWKEIAAMQIQIGGAWKEVAGAQLQISGDWKTIF